MKNNVADETQIYKVVVNHEEQYSVWPVNQQNPLGWKDAGFDGPKAACLAYIEEVWTDMHPLSVKRQFDTRAA